MRKFKRFSAILAGALLLICAAVLCCCAAKQVKLSFETNGGTEIPAIEAMAGEDISGRLPKNPVREGFEFLGWFLDKACTGQAQQLPSVMPEKNTTYYAKWAEAKKATLTLKAGAGGTIAQTTYELYAGTNLLDFLKDKQPTAEEGLTFAGWYQGTTALTGSETMSASGITLEAKFFAPITINVYVMNDDGSYPSEPTETLTDQAIYGEAYRFDVKRYEEYAMYRLDETADGAHNSASSLGKNETFEVYLSGNTILVKFDLNLKDVMGTPIEDLIVRYGMQVEIADGSEFRLPQNYRFIGWSLTPEGEIVFQPGRKADTSLFTESTVTLYAQWEIGIADFFGGEDYLFLSQEEETVTLRRAGLPEKRGTYDPATGYFRFREEGKTLLEGRIDGDRFYYYSDLSGRTFESGDGSNETIVFGGSDKITFHGTNGDIEGIYRVDTQTGEYIFESEGLSFHFTINYQTGEDGQTRYLFNRPSGEERGFYMLTGDNEDAGSAALFLDGMWDENGIAGAMLYERANNLLTAVGYAFYQLSDETTNTYALLSADGVERFLFRLDTSYEETMGSVQFSGSFVMSDGYNHTYTNYDELEVNPSTALVLDGFGSGTLEGKAGTYKIERNAFYMIDTYDGNSYVDTWEDDWISFTTLGSPKTRFFRLAQNGATMLYNYQEFEERPRLVEVSHSLSKVYGFTSNLPDRGAFYLYGFGYAYVLACQYSEELGADVYELIDIGTYEEQTGGIFTFSSEFYTDQEDYDFKFDGKTIVTSIPGGEEYTLGNNFKIEKWGDLTYDGKTYAYGDWGVSYIEDYFGEFRVEMYSFDGKNCFVRAEYEIVEDEDGEERIAVASRELLEDNAVVDLVLRFFVGQDDYFDRIYLIDEEHAAIALLVDDSEFFLIFGDLYQEDDDGILFTLDESYDYSMIRPEMLQPYREFLFRLGTFNGKTAAIVSIPSMEASDAEGATFVPDGFGNAVYTPKNGTPIKGTYENLDLYGSLISFRSEDGSTEFLLSYLENDEGEIEFYIVDAPEAGHHFMLYGGNVYYSDCIVLFGDATEEEEGTAFYISEYGTYRKTGKTVNYWLTGGVWTEYELSFPQENGTLNTFKIAISSIRLLDGSLTSVYIDEMPLQADRNIPVEGGGMIRGDGYNVSYTDLKNTYYGILGIGKIHDDSPIRDNYHWEDDFEAGPQLIFYADYIQTADGYDVLEERREFLFDFNSDRSLLTLRDDFSGTFALYERGRLVEDSSIYLDGHGNATIRNKYGITDQGTYTYSQDRGVLFFKSGNENGSSFSFVRGTYLNQDELWLIYYSLDEESVYIADDWSVLLLGSLRTTEIGGTEQFINGEYVTDKGRALYGFYDFVSDEIVCFESLTDGATYFFDLKGGSFSINREEFIIRDGVLLGYQGDRILRDLKIPDGVREIGSGVFSRLIRLDGNLDLNEVEIIGDHAFYNIPDSTFPTVSSDKVTYVGDYAFFTESFFASEELGGRRAHSALYEITLKRAKYIGDYAFYGCNQLNIGTTTLEDVEYIGNFAFTHNYFTSGDVMTLDLTNADISKIDMQRNAFFPGWGTNEWENFGWPVRIYVKDLEAYAQTADWFEEIRKTVRVKGVSEEDPLSGEGFYNFETKEYLSFGETGEGEFPSVTRFVYSSSDLSYTAQSDYAVYAANADGSVGILFEDGSYIALKEGEISFTKEGTFYRTNAQHTLSVKEGNEQKDLVFSFSAETEVFLFSTDVTITLESAKYDGHEDMYESPELSDKLSLTYEENDKIYSVSIDLTAKTAEKTEAGVILYSQDKTYKATLTNPLSDGGYYYLDLSKKEGENYTLLLSSLRRDSTNPEDIFYRGSVSGENAETTYTIRISQDKNSVTVTESKVSVLTVSTEEYQATFTFEEGKLDDAVSLKSFKVYEYGYWDDILSGFGFTVEKKEKNTFTVSVGGYSSSKEYIVKFVPASGSAQASLEVTLKEYKVVSVDTQYESGDDYYTVRIVVDGEGNIVRLGDEITSHTYSSGFYDSFSYMVPSEVTRNGNTFTFTSSGSEFTVTVTKSGEEFEVTVTQKDA